MAWVAAAWRPEVLLRSLGQKGPCDGLGVVPVRASGAPGIPAPSVYQSSGQSRWPVHRERRHRSRRNGTDVLLRESRQVLQETFTIQRISKQGKNEIILSNWYFTRNSRFKFFSVAFRSENIFSPKIYEWKCFSTDEGAMEIFFREPLSSGAKL